MNTNNIDPSHREEIIGILWLIAAILCFGLGYTTWGWILLVKSVIDFVIAIYFSIIEVRMRWQAQKEESADEI